MVNKCKFSKIINTIKSVCFSRNLIPTYIVIAAMFLLMDALVIQSLFRPGDEWFGTDFGYLIFLVFASVGILFLTVIAVPLYLNKKIASTQDDSDEYTDTPAFIKILSVWLPICICTVAQTLIFLLCALLSKYFVLPFGEALFNCVSLCVMYLIWILVIAFLYYCSGSVLWYVVGFLTVNLAPLIIVGYCDKIYDINPFAMNFDYNPLNFNFFTLSAATIVSFRLFMLIMAIISIGVLIIMWLLSKKQRTVKQHVFSTVYKILVIFMVSLSCGFMVSEPFMGENALSSDYIICFLITALAVAILFSIFAFWKTRIVIPLCITVLAVFIASALVLEGIPALTHKKAYYLPERDEIESIRLYLDSNHTLEIKEEHFDECLTLNKILLDKFEKGYLPEPYPGTGEQTGIVDRWDEADFKYTLKDGETVYKYYNHFYNPAFDELYIELYRSGIYTDYLQNVESSTPYMRYYIKGGKENGKWCESLPEECADTLIDVYCDELLKAQDSAFYEEYELIIFSGCKIWVPLSFTETRNLAKEYVDEYCKY